MRVPPAAEWSEMPGPIGPIAVAWAATGIVLVEPAGDGAGFELDVLLSTGRTAVRVPAVPGYLAEPVTRQVAGDWQPDLPLDLSMLTRFTDAALRATMRIPRGEVRPYAWVAREIGRPRAVRAVGSALGNNPLPFVVPCHRVVKADGRVGEYGAGGPEAKRRMLRLEGVDPDALDALADAGVRYLGEHETGRYHYPTCHASSATRSRDRDELRDAGHAHALGYEPCPTCRPLAGPVF